MGVEWGANNLWLGVKLLQRKFPKHSLKEWTSKKMWWRGRYNSLGRRKRMCNNHGGSKEREQSILQVFLQCKVRRLILINSILHWESPRQTPGWWFKGLSLRTHSWCIILTAMMYYSKRVQGQSAKRKGTGGKVRRKPDSSFRVLSHRTLQQAGTMHVKHCLLGKLIRDPVRGFLVGAGHIVPPWLVCSTISDSKNESTCSA